MPIIHDANDAEGQATTNKSSSTIWAYAQTFLKGVGILGVGSIMYAFYRSFSNTSKNDISILNKRTLLEVSNLEKTINAEFFYQNKRNVVPVSGEILVNSDTLNDQFLSVSATLLNGDFVVVWVHDEQSSNITTRDIYAKRFSDDGIVITNQFLVAKFYPQENFDDLPAIAALSDGGYVIAWSSYNQVSNTSRNDIYAKCFSSNDVPLSTEFLVNNYFLTSEERPAIAALDSGQFVITWSGGFDIVARRFANNGTVISDEFTVDKNSMSVCCSSVVFLKTKELIIVWRDASSVYMQKFSKNGAALGTSTLLLDNNVFPKVTVLKDDGIVLTWAEYNQTDKNIFTQIFSSDGMALSAKISVDLDTDSASTSPGIATLSNGQFVITWDAYHADIYNSWDIYAKLFLSNGTLLKDSFLVNTYVTNLQKNPSVTALADGKFAITWTSVNQSSNIYDYNIFAKIFTSGSQYNLPFLLKNNLIIDQAQTKSITLQNIMANSGGGVAFDDLLFLTSEVQYGWFIKNESAVPIFNFTQAELRNGLIKFVHDGSYSAPVYKIAVDDSFNITYPVLASIDFYRKPLFLHNQFSVANGKTFQLTANAISAATNKNNAEINFEVQNVTRGGFSLNNAVITFADTVTNFSQAQINAGQIWFVHDGSNIPPSYFIRAISKNLASEYQAGLITFKPSGNNKNIIIGATVGTAVSALLVAAGIFGGYRYKKAKDYAEERAKYPLANALYNALAVEGVENFKSAKGVAFVNAVNAIEGYLKIDTQQMIQEELDELANKLARAIKAQVNHTTGLLGGIELNLSDIEYQAEAIVQTTQTLNGGALTPNANEMEMKVVSQKSELGMLASHLQERGLDINNLKSVDMKRLADVIVEAFDEQARLPKHLKTPS